MNQTDYSKKHFVALGLGSNLGDRECYLLKAVKDLIQFKILDDVKISPFYETEPWGNSEQPSFINAAIIGYTALAPEELLIKVKNLEIKLGRISRGFWKEREIDIDILLFDNLIVDFERLKIPHPKILERKFVLKPLSDLIPLFVHPIAKISLKQALNECKDDCNIKLINNPPLLEAKSK